MYVAGSFDEDWWISGSSALHDDGHDACCTAVWTKRRASGEEGAASRWAGSRLARREVLHVRSRRYFGRISGKWASARLFVWSGK